MSLTILLTAFGAGLLTSLSPCVYPMLPITLGYLGRGVTANKNSQRLNVIAFFVGQVFSFTLLGIAAVKLGEIFGFSSQSKTVSLCVGLLLLVMGVISLSPRAQSFLANINSLLPFKNMGGAPTVVTGFLVGASSALVASPCTSPVLGGVLSQIATVGDFTAGVVQMAAFASGMGALFLLLGLGLINFKRLPRAGHWMKYANLMTTVFLFIGAGYYLIAPWLT